MDARLVEKQCLTYIPVPHLGYWVVQICVSILEHFPSELLSARLFLPRAFAPIASSVDVREAVPHLIPYRFASGAAQPMLNYRFKRALATSDPRTTVAYFWPSPPLDLVRLARRQGIITVREMINTYTGSAKVILDDAYARLGLPPAHAMSEESVEREREELMLYDYIFAPSPLVEKSLLEAGVNPDKILRSTYGWLPSRFASSVENKSKTSFRALCVGTLCVRKGIPQLLAAWEKSGVAGELVLAGMAEESLKPLLARYSKVSGVRFAGFTLDVARLYRSSDVFIFPTLEEGDPLVTYEAAACALPIIATPMGSGNLVRDNVNGLVVKPHDVDGLADAVSRLATSPQLRNRLGLQAAKDAQNYTYHKVGSERARILSNLLNAHRGEVRSAGSSP